MLQNRNGQEIAVPASEIKRIKRMYIYADFYWNLKYQNTFLEKIEKNYIKFSVQSKSPFFLENILAEALTIYIEMYFEKLKIGFGYDIILMKSFCKGEIPPASNKNVLKKLGAIAVSY